MRKWIKLEAGLILSAITVMGLALAALGRWGLGVTLVENAGLVLAFAAGGVPATIAAVDAMVRHRTLDIDLLMVVAAWPRCRSVRRWKARYC